MIPPRSLRGDDLVLSHFSLARDHPLDDRIESASAAGFAGIGLFAGEFIRLREQGLTVEQLRALLEDADICLAEVEVLAGWGAAQPTDAYRSFESVVWELVDAFECRYVQAIGPYEGSASSRFVDRTFCSSTQARDFSPSTSSSQI